MANTTISADKNIANLNKALAKATVASAKAKAAVTAAKDKLTAAMATAKAKAGDVAKAKVALNDAIKVAKLAEKAKKNANKVSNLTAVLALAQCKCEGKKPAAKACTKCKAK